MVYRKNVDKLLILEDFDCESIFDVLGRMELLSDLLENEKRLHGFLPFLHVYYLVTKGVADSIFTKRHFFDDYKKVEQLDIAFAKLYFEPLRKLLKEAEFVKPWANSFQLSKENHSPFIKMLTGINAHINSDLVQALVETDYDNHHDYLLVNEILENIVPEIFHYLAFKTKDMYGIGGLVLKGFTEKEFLNTVIRWRMKAWDNAQIIKRKNIKNYLRPIHLQTENISLLLVDILEEYWKLENIQDKLYKLNHIQVVI